ncbi:MAG: ABC transporter ATP-binding protein [Promethearchaeota archaeon]
MFLECHDVFKLYTNPVTKIQVPALRGVELSCEEGEIIAIIGPGGAGKSTLINLIGGIDKPSSGSITVDGKVVNKMKKKELNQYRRQEVGFLHQFPNRNLMWNITAFQNVIFPMKLTSRWGLQKQKKRALELLSRVGLENRAHHKPHQLSGGEAQRAGIAVALANDPKIILADEPTGDLDSVSTFKIIDYFQEVNKDLGKTFVVVTHDHRFSNMTKRAVNILDGQIVGMHRRADFEKTASEREEVFYLDERGNLHIPEHLRKKAGVKKHVKLELIDGRITIIPVKGDHHNE